MFVSTLKKLQKLMDVVEKHLVKSAIIVKMTLLIDLIDRLKDHSIKCKSLPEDLKDFFKSFIMSKNQTSISDSTSPEEQPLDKMDADKKLARFFYSTGIP